MIYAAHIKECDGTVQTVAEHCKNVENLSEKFCKKLSVKSILKLAAILHDLGKMTEDFNLYIRNENDLRRGDIDHSFAGAKYIIDFSMNFDDEYIRETADFIGRIIISHHGLHDWIDSNFQNHLKTRIEKNERYDEICRAIPELITAQQTETLLKAAADEFMNIKNKIRSICQGNRVVLTFYMGMLERLAQSVLVDADRTDTAEFMCGTQSSSFDPDEVFDTMCTNIENMNIEFKKKTDNISKYRMDISDRCRAFAESERGICRLIVPTGGGKTVSSFRFAANYCKKFHKEKIFYIAPFMSILEQNTDVLKSIVGNDEYLLEHHSNILAEIDDEEELNEYELKIQSWDAPVISTTMVQFLNTLFLGKMSSVRRFHRLANSVIIIDEVQSIPIKCVYLFNLAMNFLSKICGCTIVLCSATQPSLESVEYPLTEDGQSSMTQDFRADFEKFKRTQLISALKKEKYTFSEAADFAYEKYLENNNLLMIMNTKKSALELFKLLKDKNEYSDEEQKAEIVYLSTLMCPAHRKNKLDLVRELLARNKPVICVTTQLIEAGVDISFNCVIRSLAGIESIAQAAGRCNRHGKDDIRPVYVINLKDEKLGSLKEIESGQKLSYQFISRFGSEIFENDKMNIYFKKLYNEYKDQLAFPIKKSNETLLQLLSTNTDRYNVCNNKPKYAFQAFKTSGEYFKAIDNDTKDVIIPYNEEAKDIILSLNSDIDIKEQIKLLKKAQKYTVGVYPHAFDSMYESSQIYELNCKSAFALKDEYFSDDYGIGNENAYMNAFIY